MEDLGYMGFQQNRLTYLVCLIAERESKIQNIKKEMQRQTQESALTSGPRRVIRLVNHTLHASLR